MSKADVVIMDSKAKADSWLVDFEENFHRRPWQQGDWSGYWEREEAGEVG